MVYDYLDKYTFMCEMYDEEANEIIDLILHFFPFDNSVQVINPKRGVNLLRRVQLPTMKMDMLQIGNVVNVFSKLLLITDCSDATRRSFLNNIQSTFAMIKPIPPTMHGKIITFILSHGFRIVQMRNGKLSKDFAKILYKHLSGENIMPMIIDYVTSGEVIGMELVAPDAIAKWRKCLGSTNPAEAEPGTLRRTYGENMLRNVAHGCQTMEDATRMINEFFGYENGIPKILFRATLKDCSCCVLKPHTLIDGNAGAILEQISTSGLFYISAMAMFTVTITNSLEFYEIYKNVLPEYKAMAIHMAEGKCIALEIKCTDPSLDCVAEFRKFCGPRDPDICRQLYPESIRARFGKSIIHNAVHCTDLPEDGETEVEYFFKILAYQ